jgi:hypothetical protein
MVALPLPVMVTTPPSMVAAAGSVPVLIVATLVVRFTLIVPVENKESDLPQRDMFPYL